MVGLARDEVAAACASVDQEADPGGTPALDLGAIGGAEQVMRVAVSFSTQRNAGMSSFEPSRIPACEAPVWDERSVSHSVSR